MSWIADSGYHSEYVQAKMKAESGTITLDYYRADRYDPKPAAKNLYDVECFREYGCDDTAKYEEWWQDLYIRARSNVAVKTIRVKFERLESERYGSVSEGIVGTQYNSHLIYGKGYKDYTIKIIAPADDEYLNIYWCCSPDGTNTFVFAKMKAESGTITLGFNEAGVATKNLYDVRVLHSMYYEEYYEWKELKARAGST